MKEVSKIKAMAREMKVFAEAIDVNVEALSKNLSLESEEEKRILERINIISKKAVDLFGVDAQLFTACEEMGEMIQALSKYKRGVDNRHNIIEELADLVIMLKQIEVIFNINNQEVVEMVDKKLTRLDLVMEEYKFGLGKKEKDIIQKFGISRNEK